MNMRELVLVTHRQHPGHDSRYLLNDIDTHGQGVGTSREKYLYLSYLFNSTKCLNIYLQFHFFYYLHVAVVLEVGDVSVECVGGAEGGDTADTRTVDHCVHRLYASAVTHSFENLCIS